MSAREDYQHAPLKEALDMHYAMCDEIDRLRSVVERYSQMLTVGKAAQIQEVADSIANGVPTCGATWVDTEARGWLWYCSLPVGHAGHHRCVGASW